MIPGRKFFGSFVSVPVVVDEYDVYIVSFWQDGKLSSVRTSSQEVAASYAAFYEREGCTEISIEKKHEKIYGQRLI